MKHGCRIVAAAAIALAACAQAPRPLSTEARVALADSISALATQAVTNLGENATAEKVLDLYVRGNDLIHAEYGTLYPSYDSIVKVVNAMYRPGTKFSATLDNKRVTVLDRDFAVFAARMTGTMTDSAGKQMPFTEVWTAVYQRTPDGWKIVADHESAPPAPAKPARR